MHELDDLRERLRARPGAPWRGAEGARLSAVAAILRPAPAGPEVLLIRRAENAADPWSGHIALPGGRREPGDRDLLETATRETREEVGLDLRAHGEHLGALDDLPAIARARFQGMVIRPHVFTLTADPTLTLSDEVAEALWAPLGPMLSGAAATTRPYEHEGARLELPAFDVEGRLVWGLTYQMLQSLFRMLRGD